jgi:hypothetical protein
MIKGKPKSIHVLHSFFQYGCKHMIHVNINVNIGLNNNVNIGVNNYVNIGVNMNVEK